MSYQVLELNQSERARQKQASREQDLERMKRCEIGRDELQRENSFFAPLNPSKFEIVAIGGRPVGASR